MLKVPAWYLFVLQVGYLSQGLENFSGAGWPQAYCWWRYQHMVKIGDCEEVSG